jgi:hypothetical protein
MSAEPDQDITPALGAALAEPPNPNTRVQVVPVSREELEQQKETLLDLLQVFELYTRYEVEENLAEVEYLLDKGEPS